MNAVQVKFEIESLEREVRMLKKLMQEAVELADNLSKILMQNEMTKEQVESFIEVKKIYIVRYYERQSKVQLLEFEIEQLKKSL